MVVLPEPEGPMMANISPGLQYPEEGCKMTLSLTDALIFCQVRVIGSII